MKEIKEAPTPKQPQPKQDPVSTTCWTVDDFLRKVPREWMNAAVAIEAYGDVFLVQRVSLVENVDGRKCIILDPQKLTLKTR